MMEEWALPLNGVEKRIRLSSSSFCGRIVDEGTTAMLRSMEENHDIRQERE